MVKIFVGNSIEILPTLPDESVQCVVTSPPFWGLRDYGVEGQFGLEATPELYTAHLVEMFREVHRVLRNDGVCWLNLGDTYSQDTKWGGKSGNKNYTSAAGGYQTCRNLRTNSGLKPKNLVGIPWRVALALQADGWWLRSAVVWHKPNCMPESATDRPTNDYEFVFLLAKSERYFYDAEAIKVQSAESTRKRAHLEKCSESPKQKAMRENGMQGAGDTLATYDRPTRNRRAVWTIPTSGFDGAHLAVFPPALVIPCIKAGTSERGCCHQCKAPWRRIIKSTGHKNNREPAHVPNNSATKTDSTGWQPTTMSTNDWQPTCTCDAGNPIPCTVLDPFGGAGTTALVADRLGRDAILIELNPDYAEMSRQRIQDDGGIFTTVNLIEDPHHVPTRP